MTPVLDASLFVASLSPSEGHHATARRLLDGHDSADAYLVPSLFRIEVLAALSRRGEDPYRIDAVDAMIRGPRFHTCPLNDLLIARSVEVARVAKLRAYDAVYVALALIKGTQLWTLDGDVRARVGTAWPSLEVIGPM